jgi:hypothetical protein
MPPDKGFSPEWLRHMARFLNGSTGLTMALYAHFDESGKWHDAQGYICLCGYLADESGWDAFNGRWNHLLRKHHIERIHMTKFYSECKTRDIDKPNADIILTDFIEAIRQSELVQFSIGLDGRYLRHKYDLNGRRNADPALFAVQRILREIREAAKQYTHGRVYTARVANIRRGLRILD